MDQTPDKGIATWTGRLSFIIGWALGAVVALGATPRPSPSPREVAHVARWLTLVLFALILTVVVFLLGMFILRGIQRARERLTRQSPKPTDASDVWLMHKLPEDDANHDDVGKDNDLSTDDTD
jgi:alpha-beta hydrolase superfamily lysophospholipase